MPRPHLPFSAAFRTPVTPATSVKLVALLSCAVALPPALLAQGRPMTWRDVMTFRAIHGPAISDDGRFVAYEARPDRGDGELIVHDLESGERHRIARGSAARFSDDSRWLAAIVRVEAKPGKPDEKAKPGMVLLDLRSGETRAVERVASFGFAEGSRCIAWLHHRPDEKEKKGGDDPEVAAEVSEEAAPDEPKAKKTKRTRGGRLVVRFLDDDAADVEFDDIHAFAFAPEDGGLALTVATADGSGNALHHLDLDDAANAPRTLHTAPGGRYASLTWSESGERLAFLASTEDAGGVRGSGTLCIWSGGPFVDVVADADVAPDGLTVPAETSLQWSEDGRRLFFGYQEREMADLLIALAREKSDPKKGERAPGGSAGDVAPTENTEDDLYDLEAILADREIDVWHWRDPLINSNQKKAWDRFKNRTYAAVRHMPTARTVVLADASMPAVEVTRGTSSIALGRSDVRYRREITWDGRYADVHLVDLESGSRRQILTRHTGTATVSPAGGYAAWYRDGHWYLHEVAIGKTRNLTEPVDVPFQNEDHDYPSVVPGYGVSGWVENDAGVLIHDKYDVWMFPTRGGEPRRITDGRERQTVFRIVRTDPEQTAHPPGETVLLTGYHDREKTQGLFRVRLDGGPVEPLRTGPHRFEFVQKAKDAERVLFTRERYDEFPDLWVAGLDLAEPRRVSDVNPQMAELAWGKARLVEWSSLDGAPLQGVLIEPGDYQPGQRYPVLVYFYRFFSQRLHEFNQPVVNHRPCFPFYASNGYALFLPDIRFEVGRPGLAATKCLVPGVQKLIDLGVADADAIGLHGHSWSGYQTAFIVTQSDAFACAIAGAPVSNMTSAYGGVRWSTGLSRQFQYEKSQSRLGASLWEAPDRYIENSPLFFADRIRTPLLIQFGDADGAVPWYQGIELYMAMRRLDKPCVFLQYRGEGHHLEKYANKLDYATRMKEYLDHYLKGSAAPAWISEGEPYRGK